MHIMNCTKCNKNTDGLTSCSIDGDVSEHLCSDCMDDSGYCLGCGDFAAGQSSFDFSQIRGYCEHCVDQIQADSGERYRDEDDYLPY